MTTGEDNRGHKRQLRVSRRAALAAGIGSVVGAGTLARAEPGWGDRPPRVGVALGGGGAKGLGHLVVYEALEELGVVPTAMAGTSSGALFGALIATGRSCSSIRRRIRERFLSDAPPSRGSVSSRYMPEAFLKVLDVVDPSLGEGGLVKGERFLRAVFGGLNVGRLEDLKIPLRVVATDYWAREAVVFERGELLPIVQASTALPGLFTPVKRDGRLLVDGGLTNPVPFDLLHDRCDLVIAVDAIGNRARTPAAPTSLDMLLGSFQVMQKAIARAKAEAKPPHIYVSLETTGVATLEWYRAEEIYEQAQPAKAQLKKLLREVLKRPKAGRK